MEVDDIVNIINEKADLYEKVSRELSNIISEINEKAVYRIDLFEEHPYLTIEVKGLGLNYKINPQDILDETISGKDIRYVIIENIKKAIHESVMKNK